MGALGRILKKLFTFQTFYELLQDLGSGQEQQLPNLPVENTLVNTQ
jgi:hypothetical protein